MFKWDYITSTATQFLPLIYCMILNKSTNFYEYILSQKKTEILSYNIVTQCIDILNLIKDQCNKDYVNLFLNNLFSNFNNNNRKIKLLITISLLCSLYLAFGNLKNKICKIILAITFFPLKKILWKIIVWNDLLPHK